MKKNQNKKSQATNSRRRSPKVERTAEEKWKIVVNNRLQGIKPRPGIINL